MFGTFQENEKPLREKKLTERLSLLSSFTLLDRRDRLRASRKTHIAQCPRKSLYAFDILYRIIIDIDPDKLYFISERTPR